MESTKKQGINVSIIIHSYNSEKQIVRCIDSARLLTDKIVVIDTESVDNTVSLAKKLLVDLYNFSNQSYVEPSREFGISKATTDWVFILDADERITKELTEEILFAIRDPRFSYYKIPRKNIFGNPQAGGWLKHGGWWPDYQIRLINRKFFKTWPKEIHSTPLIEGQGEYLKQPLIHYFHGDFDSMVNKTTVFEDIESDLLLKANRPVSSLIFFRKFWGELYRRLIQKFGFLDGSIGIIESIYQAFSKTITYLFLYEKNYNKKSRAV